MISSALFLALLPLTAPQVAKSSLPTPTQPPLATNATIQSLEKKAGLAFDELFPRQPFSGWTSYNPSWSKTDRFLAYEFRPYGERQGADLYVYEVATGKSRRLTSPDLMKAFDRDVPKALERYQKEEEEFQKALKFNDLEWREWNLKRKEDAKKRKEPQPSYSGPGEYEWAPDRDELLVTYRGDVFRWDLSKSTPERLTSTKDNESDVRYTKDGKGFTFLRGGNLYRMKFDSPVVTQLNPALPDNKPLSGYWLSPDETKIALQTVEWDEPNREISFVSYDDRFAKVEKRMRGVADDEFKMVNILYLYDLKDNDDVTKDGKPWEIWKYTGGKAWQEATINAKPWSPDSSRFTYGTWNGLTGDLQISVADLGKRENKPVYKAKPKGDHGTPGMASPFYTTDGTQIIAMLDPSGFRHAWLIDPLKEGATQLTKGDFDVYPIRQSPDGKVLFVSANPMHPSKDQLYAVDMASGELKRITQQDGVYENAVMSESTQQVAFNFKDWTKLPELYVKSGNGETKITDSHSSPTHVAALDKVNTVKPELFTYKNRNGQTVHGYMFLPPGYKKTDKRPLFIYVYGGPLGRGNSVEVGVFNSTAYWFNVYLTRVLGYVTATIDPRGSSGYGNAFGSANFEKPGQAQVEDLADGARWFQKNYNTDPEKTGITGWSFGGWQTQMCMYTAPDVFTMGIAGAGPTQWQNYNTWYTNGVIGFSPSGKPDDLDKYSLTYLAKNLRSPLLLLHGMVDDNVLFQDTVNVYRKLLQYGRGPLVELALDPTGNHGMGGDMDSRDRHAIYLGFINKWWGPYTKP